MKECLDVFVRCVANMNRFKSPFPPFKSFANQIFRASNSTFTTLSVYPYTINTNKIQIKMALFVSQNSISNPRGEIQELSQQCLTLIEGLIATFTSVTSSRDSFGSDRIHDLSFGSNLIKLLMVNLYLINDY